MKALLILTMIILIAITSVVGYTLFLDAQYSSSALLMLTSFLSVTFWIYVISNKKVVLS